MAGSEVLGVLGGMGPMATVDFLRKLVEATPAARDQDHLAVMVAQAADIPDRTRAILGQGPDPLPAMTLALRRLEAAGATRLAIPCNTAHHWHGALQALTPIPILHIVDAVATALAHRGLAGGPVGLLATDGTLRTGLYPRHLGRHGFTCHVPTDQAAVMRAVRLVKAGRGAEARPLLEAAAAALMAGGCRQVVMACTEIPLALCDAAEPLGAALLDATDALARACIAAAVPASRAA
jgi:aspartate racemase